MFYVPNQFTPFLINFNESLCSISPLTYENIFLWPPYRRSYYVRWLYVTIRSWLKFDTWTFKFKKCEVHYGKLPEALPIYLFVSAFYSTAFYNKNLTNSPLNKHILRAWNVTFTGKTVEIVETFRTDWPVARRCCNETLRRRGYHRYRAI